MIKLFSVPVAALLAAGCSTTMQPRPLSDDHPASVDAQSAPVAAPSDALRHSDPVMNSAAGASTGGESHDHGGMGGMNMGGMPGPTSSTERSGAAAAAYVCPMHPEVTSDQPSKCPKCGMKLVKNEQGGAAGGQHGGH